MTQERKAEAQGDASVTEHEGVAVPHFKTFMPPAREYLTQYSAVRCECSYDTMGESKSSGPHGRRAQGMASARGHCLSLP